MVVTITTGKVTSGKRSVPIRLTPMIPSTMRQSAIIEVKTGLLIATSERDIFEGSLLHRDARAVHQAGRGIIDHLLHRLRGLDDHLLRAALEHLDRDAPHRFARDHVDVISALRRERAG